MSCYGKKARNKTIDPLSKKIPKNPRYDYVKSSIDTGSSITRYMAKIDEIRENYKFRKDEIFKRMKVTTFAQLALQIHRTSQLENLDFPNGDDCEDSTPRNHDDDDDDDISCLGGGGDDGGPSTKGRSLSPVPSLAVTEGDYGIEKLDTERSTLQSVIKGYGQYDISHPADDQVIPSPSNCPYLLLDIRDPDDYRQCSITTALNYPKANLSKAVNYETKEMLEYKNKPGKIIIIYDEDERIAHSSATTLVQRGYDNLFMLSGGLKVAYKFFPEALLFGRPPASICATAVKGRSNRGQRNAADISTSTLWSNEFDANSLDDCRRFCFTTSEIDVLEELLDNALLNRNVGCRMSDANSSRSSVRSSASTLSVRSTVSSVPSYAPIGRPAFKP